MSSNNQIAEATGQLAPIARPPLLITESADEFAALLAALRQEIKPKGIIENIYLEDLAAIVWEIQRLRRCRTGIVNNAIRAALKSLLNQLLVSPDILDRLNSEAEAVRLADAWFVSQKAKKEALAILRRFNLDENAIEAEAVRLSWSDLELIDRMQTSLRSRLDKTLRCVADYRDSLAVRMRQSSDRIVENDEPLCLELIADKKSAA
jgi:hypothetical protein